MADLYKPTSRVEIRDPGDRTIPPDQAYRLYHSAPHTWTFQIRGQLVNRGGSPSKAHPFVIAGVRLAAGDLVELKNAISEFLREVNE